MKINTRIAVLTIFALVVTFVPMTFGQMVGGYKSVPVTGDEVTASADFALIARSEKTGLTYDLDRIIKAERQIVQGSNYRLCMAITPQGRKSVTVQAVVYVDLQGEAALSSWAISTCGNPAPAAPIMVGGFKKMEISDPMAIAAADFAVGARSVQTGTQVSAASITSAEYQMVQGMNYRLCLRLDDADGNGLATPALVTVYQDLKRKYTLSKWVDGGCR